MDREIARSPERSAIQIENDRVAETATSATSGNHALIRQVFCSRTRTTYAAALNIKGPIAVVLMSIGSDTFKRNKQVDRAAQMYAPRGHRASLSI